MAAKVYFSSRNKWFQHNRGLCIIAQGGGIKNIDLTTKVIFALRAMLLGRGLPTLEITAKTHLWIYALAFQRGSVACY